MTKKNLVITAAFGFKINQLELFIKSLRKYYFEDICFVINGNDLELKNELQKYNCNIILKDIDKRDIQQKRYEIFKEYLDNTNYENILLCDSRDIYFQSNPFDYKFNSPLNFFLEDKIIKECPYNSNWLIKSYGKEEFNKIKDKIILCSGTVIGSNEKIVEYLDLMIKNIKKYKYKKRLKYALTFRRDPNGRGVDQGHANFIVNNNLIKNFNLHSNHSGPISTVYYLKEIKFDDKWKLINSKNQPYAVVHQYDKRWSEFSKSVQNLKKELKIN
jgi:hypothetical protein